MVFPHTHMHAHPFSSSQGRSLSASSFHTSLLQAIDGVSSLALCPQVVSQAPQHFGSSETQPACDGCFSCQSVCSVISCDSRMLVNEVNTRQTPNSKWRSCLLATSFLVVFSWLQIFFKYAFALE